jgi:inner membrane protein
MTLLWWHWLALGLILIAVELSVAGGFYVMFVGLAALAVGVLTLVGLSGPVGMQLLLFSVLSIVCLLVFRSPLLRWLKLDGPGNAVDSLVGESATPLEDIAPGAVGRAELRGTVWTARNSSPAPVVRGQRCVVVRVVQLMVFIEPEGASA